MVSRHDSWPPSVDVVSRLSLYGLPFTPAAESTQLPRNKALSHFCLHSALCLLSQTPPSHPEVLPAAPGVLELGCCSESGGKPNSCKHSSTIHSLCGNAAPSLSPRLLTGSSSSVCMCGQGHQGRGWGSVMVIFQIKWRRMGFGTREDRGVHSAVQVDDGCAHLRAPNAEKCCV